MLQKSFKPLKKQYRQSSTRRRNTWSCLSIGSHRNTAFLFWRTTRKIPSGVSPPFPGLTAATKVKNVLKIIFQIDIHVKGKYTEINDKESCQNNKKNCHNAKGNCQEIIISKYHGQNASAFYKPQETIAMVFRRKPQA